MQEIFLFRHFYLFFEKLFNQLDQLEMFQAKKSTETNNLFD